MVVTYQAFRMAPVASLLAAPLSIHRSGTRDRTWDDANMNRALCQLSYTARRGCRTLPRLHPPISPESHLWVLKARVRALHHIP